MESGPQMRWLAPKPITEMVSIAAEVCGSVMQHALGAMAAQRMFGSRLSITRERGHWRRLDTHVEGFATWHPSAALRAG